MPRPWRVWLDVREGWPTNRGELSRLLGPACSSVPEAERKVTDRSKQGQRFPNVKS
jgi:hypothetical protein